MMEETKKKSEKRINVTGANFLKTVDRVTYAGRLHHQHEGDDSVSFDFSGHSYCTEQEQPYKRMFKLTPNQLTKIDYGWLKDKAGLLVIENREGRSQKMNLTDEEIQEVQQKVLRIYFGSSTDLPFAVVRPGGIPFVAEMSSETAIELFSEYAISITIYVLPR